MADRVYPSAKPPQPLSNSAAATAPKSQIFRPPAYRPATKPPSRRRSRCCSCCLWLTFIIFTLILLAAAASAVLYILYRPRRPSFSVSSVRFSSFNLTSSRLSSNLNLTISARNPNKKLVFYYDPSSISVFSDGVEIGDGSFNPFIHTTKSTTLIKAAVSTGSPRVLDSSSAASISSGLKRKEGLPLQIQLETKVRVKMGGLKTKRVRVRVNCDGIDAVVPKGKSTAAATTSGAKCKVKIRIKIWKWQL
ncbi:NDR1/HIN1-like protein 13 [Magnolia sinica]|uniref:NDR1/HIN1-like protein 13 n=1 Tax=Magnolia sinica TaxID=86752 RepID=UPI0026583BEB|nr:NDR1/HIN1-like protein 13 [Magnolia sinica]